MPYDGPVDPGFHIAIDRREGSTVGAQIWHLEIEINNYCKVLQSSTACTCLNAIFLTILPEHLCLADYSK